MGKRVRPPNCPDGDVRPVLTSCQAVGGGSPRSLTEHLSEVLLSLNRHCPALLSQWLKETLQTPGFPSTHVSPEQKHTFTQQLLRYERHRQQHCVQQFTCRLILVVEAHVRGDMVTDELLSRPSEV